LAQAALQDGENESRITFAFAVSVGAIMLSVPVSYAAVLILLIQNSAPAPAKPSGKVPAPCTVSGRVVTAAEGAPLKSSRVALMLEHESREPQVYAAVSDSDGGFTIKDVPAGRYHFIATHTGYVDQEYQSNGGETGAILALQAGQDVNDVIFRLTLAAVITGRVSDEDGEPMGLVKIVALSRPSEEETEDRDNFSARQPELRPATMAQTDDRGQYRLFGLKPGEYYIQAADEYEPPQMDFGHDWEIRRSLGSQFAPAYYPGVTQIGQAEAVTVTPGEEAQADFIMRHIRTVQVAGHVIGADGKPATDAFLYLEELPAADFGTFEGIETDAKGDFKIKGVAPGSYLLHAQQHTSEEPSYHASQKIEVGSDNIDSIVLALGRGVSFAGRVEATGAGRVPFDRLFISMSSHDDETGGAWARVKKDGTFEMLDVPDGSFAFSINGLEEGWYIKAVRLGGADILTKGLEVEKGESGGTIEVVLSKGGAQLEGSVKQDDKPMVGVRVRITPDPETPYNRLRSRSTSTDQGGHFSFIGIAPGHYRAIAKTTGPAGANRSASAPQIINVSEHEHKTIELTVAPPQTQ